MIGLKTDPSLLSAIHAATLRTPTSEQIERQRLSFIMSAVNKRGDVSEQQVMEVLDRQQGKPNR